MVFSLRAPLFAFLAFHFAAAPVLAQTALPATYISKWSTLIFKPRPYTRRETMLPYYVAYLVKSATLSPNLVYLRTSFSPSLSATVLSSAYTSILSATTLSSSSIHRL